MALPDLIAQLVAEVNNDTTVMNSAITLINGIAQRITDAVNAALAAGATQAQLQAITDAVNQLKSNDNALAGAVQANTPVVVPPTPVP